jgi:dihydrofolate reductase
MRRIHAAAFVSLDGVMQGPGKYVLSRGTHSLDWANSQHLAGIEDVAALKQTDGPDLVIQGSSTLYPPLLAAGLIDRLTLMIFPTVLGRGKRLFGEGTQPGLPALVEQRAGVQGTLIAAYEQCGSLPSMPDFAPQQSTSERKTTRQQAMREGVW